MIYIIYLKCIQKRLRVDEVCGLNDISIRSFAQLYFFGRSSSVRIYIMLVAVVRFEKTSFYLFILHIYSFAINVLEYIRLDLI